MRLRIPWGHWDDFQGAQMMLVELSAQRVLEACKAALEGRAMIRQVDGPVGEFTVWEVGHGLIKVDIEDLRICFYIDDGQLDYCEWAEDRGGLRGEFDHWYDLGTEPVAQLSEVDQEQLRKLIEAA